MQSPFSKHPQEQHFMNRDTNLIFNQMKCMIEAYKL